MSGICNQYAESGMCTYGARCKFPHVVLAESSATMKKNTKKGKTQNGTSSGLKDVPKNRTKSRKKAKKQTHPSRGSIQAEDHLEAFFAQYPAFTYRPEDPSTSNFHRMCRFFDWERDDTEQKAAYQDFRTALVEQFNSIYGTEVDDIKSWRGLCLALDIFPVPDTAKAAQKIFKGMYVNLVDLVDTDKTGDAVTQFDSLEDLREYTTWSGKVFPKESAYAGGVLKFLLREIHGRYEGNRTRAPVRRARL